MSASDSLEWTACEAETPDTGTPVRTACGGIVRYSPATPCVKFRGQRVFFCLPACKEDFERDPLSSCMAIRIQEMDLRG